MKKYLLSALAFMVLSVGFLPFEVEAANMTARFRGRSWADFVKYRDKIRERTQYKPSRQRSSYMNIISSAQRRTSTSVRSPQAAKTGSIRRSTNRLVFGYQNASGIQAKRNLSTSKILSADSGEFSVMLPDGFEKISDSLEKGEGKILFKKNKTTVEVRATNETCAGSFTFLRRCLQDKSDTYLKDFQKGFAEKMTLVRNESMYLDASKTRFDKENTAWWVELSAPAGTHIAQLTFFEPQRDHLWTLWITESGTQKEILDDRKAVAQIYNTLFQKSSRIIVNPRTRLTSILGNINRSQRGNSQFGSSSVLANDLSEKTFMAHNVPFQLVLPEDFELVEDSVEWSSGVMRLERGEEIIEIRPTESACKTDVPLHKRYCIEDEAKVLGKEVKEKFPKAFLLQEENMLLQLNDIANTRRNLNRSASAKNDIARILTLRTANMKIAHLTFAEPQHGFIWTMLVQSPENSDSLLGDSRTKSKFFTSLFFHTVVEEE